MSSLKSDQVTNNICVKAQVLKSTLKFLMLYDMHEVPVSLHFTYPGPNKLFLLDSRQELLFV